MDNPLTDLGNSGAFALTVPLELMNVGEYLYTSPLQRYAAEFLQSVLDYASGLDASIVMEQAAATAA